jgi:hypothetical protein
VAAVLPDSTLGRRSFFVSKIGQDLRISDDDLQSVHALSAFLRGGVMARELERAVVELVVDVLGCTLGTTPEWLLRPGRIECRTQWDMACAIYRDLTGHELPDEMPRRESRCVDAVLVSPTGAQRILEVDETQHFNRFRSRTLRHYQASIPVAFDSAEWIRRGEYITKLRGGGFGKPKPPLFPTEGGRHVQRAYRDALADILPIEHGWSPTLRIADFEVAEWITLPNNRTNIANLLQLRNVA